MGSHGQGESPSSLRAGVIKTRPTSSNCNEVTLHLTDVPQTFPHLASGVHRQTDNFHHADQLSVHQYRAIT